MNTDPTDDIYKRYVLLENENTNLKNEYAVLQSELIKTNATLEIYKQRLFCNLRRKILRQKSHRKRLR